MILIALLLKKLLMSINERNGAELNEQLAETAKLELFYCVLMSVVLVVLA